MKNLLLTLTLYIYTNFIYEDWCVYTILGKIIIYPFWLIRVLFIITLSPILSLGYYWEKSQLYKDMEQLKLEYMVIMDQMINTK